ncbi:MAG: hypothetical protein ACPGSD_08555 [Flavobacteriales bacterium]
MKKLILILSVLFGLQSCQKKEESQTNQDYTETSIKKNLVETEKLVVKEKQDLSVNRDSINDFLDNPFDLYQFKKIKKMSNSGGGRQEDYFLKPNKDGMYYRYFLFSRRQGYLGTNRDRIIRKEDGLEITVYKELGKYQYEFIDPTEELIEVKANFNDFGLPELAFVGLDSVTMIKKLGNPDLTKNNCMMYKHNNKALILNLSYKRVKWLKYVVLKKGIDIENYESLFEE